eukprot:TRINITY_DN10761_c0_g2_i1.p1 TRINITY_DN10761_c0_g2~~TRINITY_DN10761_c0_g2_i1.p1  ORF type:complete len:226 (-),score=40.22 TRINITY_DN10761_c0_g2_i1:103-756(-)
MSTNDGGNDISDNDDDISCLENYMCSWNRGSGYFQQGNLPVAEKYFTAACKKGEFQGCMMSYGLQYALYGKGDISLDEKDSPSTATSSSSPLPLFYSYTTSTSDLSPSSDYTPPTLSSSSSSFILPNWGWLSRDVRFWMDDRASRCRHQQDWESCQTLGSVALSLLFYKMSLGVVGKYHKYDDKMDDYKYSRWLEKYVYTNKEQYHGEIIDVNDDNE